MSKAVLLTTVLLGSLAALAFAPTASASTYCYFAPDDLYAYCCEYLDQSGTPGSVEYLATGVGSTVTQTSCIAPGNAYSSYYYTYECVVNGNC